MAPSHWLRNALAIALAACTLPALAQNNFRNVDLPLQIDHAFIQQILINKVYTLPGHKVRAWDDGKDCSHLTLSDPEVDTHDGRLRVISHAVARVGQAFAGRCITLLDWTGLIATTEELTVKAFKPILNVRVINSELLDEQRRPTKVSNTIWELVKTYVHPQLETVAIDLGPALNDLKGFIPLLLVDRDPTALNRILNSLEFLRVVPTETGVTAYLRFEINSIELPPREAAAAEFTPEQIAAWEDYLANWDGFFTYIVKHAAGDTLSDEAHRDLLDVLLDARHGLTDALSKPEKPGFDPVRSVFMETWNQLIPIMRRIGKEQTRQDVSVHYLSFVGAGDALRTLDALGPAAGIDVSIDGLRRFARLVAPDDQADPLAHDTEVDPALRKTFGFDEAMPVPEDNPDIDLLNWLLPKVYAAETPAAKTIETPDAETVKRLNKWAPGRDDLDDYLPLVRDLLKQTAKITQEKSKLDKQFHTLYGMLMLTTAWQESCWRQYIKRSGKITPMRSPSGSVGIMQVNPRVWRGFYDVKGLKIDIAYNAHAGSEILMHYLNDVAVAKGEHTKTKNTDNLARASYSAYNAGPREYMRYRDPKSVPREKRVDEDFWEKFQAIKNGNELAVTDCFSG